MPRMPAWLTAAHVTPQPPREEPVQQPMGVITKHTTWKPEPCCHEECAWWVTSAHYIASTWPTKDEAEAEALRLNEMNASAQQATR